MNVYQHLAMRYFSGLRTEEMKRADESRIKLDCGFIEVTDAMAKQAFAPHLAKFKNAAFTASESGHAETVMFSTFREIVTPQDAEKFWAIVSV